MATDKKTCSTCEHWERTAYLGPWGRCMLIQKKTNDKNRMDAIKNIREITGMADFGFSGMEIAIAISTTENKMCPYWQPSQRRVKDSLNADLRERMYSTSKYWTRKEEDEQMQRSCLNCGNLYEYVPHVEGVCGTGKCRADMTIKDDSLRHLWVSKLTACNDWTEKEEE